MNRYGARNEMNRITWLERTLKALPAGTRLLDAGAGQGRMRPYCTHLEYVSQDFARYDGAGDTRGLHPVNWKYERLNIVSDITAIPELDGSFDAVLCVEVLEHLPDPVGALVEFARLLKPGGQLILTAPFCSLTHYAPYHFCTGFSRYFFEHHLEKCGFSIVELEANGEYFAFLAQELRRLPFIEERYAGRRWLLHRMIRRIGTRLLLGVLERDGIKGGRSSELLAFGFHVRALRLGG